MCYAVCTVVCGQMCIDVSVVLLYCFCQAEVFFFQAEQAFGLVQGFVGQGTVVKGKPYSVLHEPHHANQKD